MISGGAESHWDVMERMALCDREEGAEGARERERKTKGETKQKFC